QCRIDSFAARTKELRGKELVRYIYTQYPHYAARSEIKEQVLNKEELQMVESSTNTDHSICLMTIGYEGKTIDAYIDMLIRHNVSLVVDVRRNPISMKYGFSKTRLNDYLNRAGIDYEHIPALGIESSQRKHLETQEDYRVLFEHYAVESLPHREEELRRIQQLIEQHRRIALTCFEADYHSCHRHKITEYLQSGKQWSIPIHHLG
ncbi:MAG TPA: DUF488 domain-containing protein, partial [Bacteroidota bacterium]|nr:DUF488 domain-containing protein [Bacteroidota bacterium]